MDNYVKEYRDKFTKYYDELKWLYCELYENRMDAFSCIPSLYGVTPSIGFNTP